MRLHGRSRNGFVLAHEPRIANHAGGDDGCQSALGALRHELSLAEAVLIRNSVRGLHCRDVARQLMAHNCRQGLAEP